MEFVCVLALLSLVLSLEEKRKHAFLSPDAPKKSKMVTSRKAIISSEKKHVLSLGNSKQRKGFIANVCIGGGAMDHLSIHSQLYTLVSDLFPEYL